MLRFVKRAVFDFSAAVQNVTHVTHSLNYCTSREAPNPNVPLLVLLVLIQVIYVCMIYGPIAAYLVEALPRQNSVHIALLAISHRKRRFRRRTMSTQLGMSADRMVR